MEKPRVSIICPVYKVENYLSRCIESIINQKYKNFELILIDDGSPDKSGEICEKYADKDERIKVFHKINGGVSSARNLGLEQSSGEWIAFVDTDDWLDEDFLNPIESVDDNIELIHQGKKMEYPDTGSKVDKLKHIGVFDTKELLTSSKWSSFCWSFFFKRELVEKNKLVFNEQLKFSEDRLFIMQYAMLSKKMLFVSSAPYHYFINNESVCRSIRDPRTFYNDLVVIESFLEFLQKYDIEITDEQVRFALEFSINGMKSDLAPYFSSINRKQIVEKLSSCKLFVQKKYNSKYDFIFDSFIKYPRLTLIITYYKPILYRLFKKW